MSFRTVSALAARGLAVVAVSVTAALSAPATAAGDLVPVRPASRALAITTLSGGGSVPTPCLTPIVQSARIAPQNATAATRRSIALLANDPPLAAERRAVDVDGNTVRFTIDRGSFDRVDASDDNANGRPDVVDAALSGLNRAQRLLTGQLDLPSPGPVDVILGRLGSGVESVAFSGAGRTGRTQLWIDPTVRSGAAGVRRAAEHQLAHAVASASGLDPAWSEAFATWVTLALEGVADDRSLAPIGRRLAASGAGLVVDDLDLASGNAAWFAFLQESYGPTAVKLAAEELGRGGSDQAALDRAIRRATGESLDAALREYQVWSLLVGPRDDTRHFSFASKLPAPEFVSKTDYFPALSVQAEPEIGPMGSAAALLRPADDTGGMTIRFEGDLLARWGADVLLVRDDGSMHRVAMPLDAEDAGEVTVPLQGVSEIVLLVRNLDPEGRAARRYTWGAQTVPGFPVEISALHAVATGDGRVVVSWDTDSEGPILGFNVLRAAGDSERATRVNPVWIPSVGGAGTAAAYSFVDTLPESDTVYRYRIEAVTPEGLTSRSDAVLAAPER